MPKLTRFGVSVESNLLDKFDALISDHNYSNRSQAISDLMQEKLVEQDWKAQKKKVAATISLVYSHHKRAMLNKMMDIQHDFEKLIISTQHIHLDHDNCLEIIAAFGKPPQILELARRLRAVKGIKHASFTMTTAGK
jgi:CopG family nickel-responsive transcriptional regulator